MGKAFKKYITVLLYWCVLSVLLGAVCGIIGALFAKSLSAVTFARAQNQWFVWLLPIAGVISVAIYKLCRVTGIGTNCVFESVKTERNVSILLAPAVFIGTCLTHLCGGSVGREGAALQMGGSISAAFVRIFRLNEDGRHILSVCGMAALFSAVFGTPIGAFVFAIEVVRMGRSFFKAVLPVLLSSVTAFSVSQLLKVHPERFLLEQIPQLSLGLLWKFVLIAVLGGGVSIIFCESLRISGKVFKKIFKNEFLRIIAGGIIIALLTYLVGNHDYNGGGIEQIEGIFAGDTVKYETFLLKIIFTAITIGAGFKGGEIIPTLFIGATFGGAAAYLLGIAPAFGAAIGMAALFAGVTNCPIATVVLCAEMFSGEGIIYIAVAAVISFLVSGNIGLYTNEKFSFLKFKHNSEV